MFRCCVRFSFCVLVVWWWIDFIVSTGRTANDKKKRTQMFQTISSLFIWFTLSTGNSNHSHVSSRKKTKLTWNWIRSCFECWVCAKSITNTMIHRRKFVHVLFSDHPLSPTLNLVQHRSTNSGFSLCVLCVWPFFFVSIHIAVHFGRFNLSIFVAQSTFDLLTFDRFGHEF